MNGSSPVVYNMTGFGHLNHGQMVTGQLLTKEMKKQTVAHPVLMLCYRVY